jgi:hypothetical protein
MAAVGPKGLFKEAIDALLRANTPLMNGVVGIYDVAPQAADSGDPSAFPYITYGIWDFVEYHTGNETGFDVMMRMHSWDRNSASARIEDVQDLLFNALHRTHAALSVAGYSVLYVDRDGSIIEDRDPQGQWHGVCEYRALLMRDAAD